MSGAPVWRAACRCGKVRLEGRGPPLAVTVCFCADCQAAAAALAAEFSDLAPFTQADHGTPLVVLRDDRFAATEGAELLEASRLAPDSPTARMVTRCCHSPMYLKYARGFWTSAYRMRFADPPPIEMWTKTEHRDPAAPAPPAGIKVYRGFGASIFWRIFKARVAMVLER